MVSLNRGSSYLILRPISPIVPQQHQETVNDHAHANDADANSNPVMIMDCHHHSGNDHSKAQEIGQAAADECQFEFETQAGDVSVDSSDDGIRRFRGIHGFLLVKVL